MFEIGIRAIAATARRRRNKSAVFQFTFNFALNIGEVKGYNRNIGSNTQLKSMWNRKIEPLGYETASMSKHLTGFPAYYRRPNIRKTPEIMKR